MTTIERSGVDHSWWRNYRDTRSAPVAPKVLDVSGDAIHVVGVEHQEPVPAGVNFTLSAVGLDRAANIAAVQSKLDVLIDAFGPDHLYLMDGMAEEYDPRCVRANAIIHGRLLSEARA